MGVWRIVQKYAHRAWLHGVHPQTLRRAFAARLLREAGANLVTVTRSLGHGLLNTTARHVWFTPEGFRALAEKLEWALSGW